MSHKLNVDLVLVTELLEGLVGAVDIMLIRTYYFLYELLLLMLKPLSIWYQYSLELASVGILFGLLHFIIRICYFLFEFFGYVHNFRPHWPLELRVLLLQFCLRLEYFLYFIEL